MASDQWQPDFVVGIDFGMTCTGVAYSAGPDWHEPRVIQDWPCQSGNEVHHKVTTALTYADNGRDVISWGFLVDLDANYAGTFDAFKLNLDPAYTDQFEDPISADQARIYFRDYLRCLRNYIEQTLEQSIPRFRDKYIEYTFSTPTTWTNPGMIDSIERALKEAGFADGYNRRIRMGLTEAEAAAVHASKNNHRQGDVIMVVDAGGGTTDINVLKVRDTKRKHMGLEQLEPVEGNAIGSALVDFKVKEVITNRLEHVRSHLRRDPEECASIMIRQRFETFKCSFGVAGSNTPFILMPVPDLPPGMDFPEAHIADSRMQLSRDQVQGIFDGQIEQMFMLIQDQLAELQRVHPREQISYLVLSGGLGSSAYVKQRLKTRCENELGTGFPCASGMEFLTVQNAQLAVVLGLVADRVQELDSGTRVFTDRCARNSYGVLCRELYHPEAHMDEKISKDPRDGKRWAEGQIHWLIKKGQNVSLERPIEDSYLLKINPGQETKPWRTDIIVSDRPRDQLPRSLRRPGARILCNVQSTLDKGLMKLKNRHMWQLSPKYYRVEFMVKVLVGPADLKFEIWSKDGDRCSRDHDHVEVKWDPPRSTAIDDDAQDMAGIYRA